MVFDMENDFMILESTITSVGCFYCSEQVSLSPFKSCRSGYSPISLARC